MMQSTQLLSQSAVAAMLLVLAGYAQYRIPSHTEGAARVMLTRILLIGTGIAFGYVASVSYATAQYPSALLVFLIGFGLVHLPAAVMLFIKHQRGAGKS